MRRKRQHIGTDLVGHIAIGSHPVGAKKDLLGLAVLKK